MRRAARRTSGFHAPSSKGTSASALLSRGESGSLPASPGRKLQTVNKVFPFVILSYLWDYRKNTVTKLNCELSRVFFVLEKDILDTRRFHWRATGSLILKARN